MIGPWRHKAGRMEQNVPVGSGNGQAVEVQRLQRLLPLGPSFNKRPAIAGADGLLVQPKLSKSPFIPTQPVRMEVTLVGRHKLVERAISAIENQHAHLIIFGERGYGKSSLVNIVAALAETAGYGVIRHTYSGERSFSDLACAILDKMPSRYNRQVETDHVTPLGAKFDWTVDEFTVVLKKICTGHLLVFIDEFDRAANSRVKQSVTELLKNVSDLALHVSFVISGFAETLCQLIPEPQSIHRAIVAISVPLLNSGALLKLIENGCEDLGLQLDPAARDALLLLSRQSPYYAQLLSLHTTNVAIRRGNGIVISEDVAAAVSSVLEDTEPLFETLMAGLENTDPHPSDLLYAAARAPCDSFGWFTKTSLVSIMELSDNVDENLTRLIHADAGPILRARQKGPELNFSFAWPNLGNHILLREARIRKII